MVISTLLPSRSSRITATMNCHNCARTTLSLFIRSLTNTEPAFAARRPLIASHPSRFHTSDARRSRKIEPFSPQSQPEPEPEPEDALTGEVPQRPERPSWQVQKAALKEKLNGEAWNPRKKLSPDTMEGIRHLHSTQPEKFTTPVLSEYFKVSPEAIRRILKSKWQPSDEELEARMQRWDKRGERIWSNLVEMGVKPPKRWRDMGVGRATNGERPPWKGGSRNMVGVGDSVREEVEDSGMMEEDIIPTVDGKGRRQVVARDVPLSERL
jgi:hypothetical protein